MFSDGPGFVKKYFSTPARHVLSFEIQGKYKKSIEMKSCHGVTIINFNIKYENVKSKKLNIRSSF